MDDMASLRGEQLDVPGVDMDGVDRDEPRARCPEPVQARKRALARRRARFFDLVLRLPDMGLDRQVELTRIGHDTRPARVADGVRSVRSKSEGQARRVL